MRCIAQGAPSPAARRGARVPRSLGAAHDPCEVCVGDFSSEYPHAPFRSRSMNDCVSRSISVEGGVLNAVQRTPDLPAGSRLARGDVVGQVLDLEALLL